MPNNGEILALLLFSPVCRVEPSRKVENDVFHDSPKAIADFSTHDNLSPGFWDDANDGDKIDNLMFYSSTVVTTTTKPVFMDIALNGEIVLKEEVGLSLNDVVVAAAAAATDDGNGLNAKLKFYDEKLIGNLNGIEQGYRTEDVISQ